MPNELRAYASWPFERNQVGSTWREPGDRVEVWFAPNRLTERDGVMMVRIQDPSNPIFSWWAPVDTVELAAGDSDGR